MSSVYSQHAITVTLLYVVFFHLNVNNYTYIYSCDVIMQSFPIDLV